MGNPERRGPNAKHLYYVDYSLEDFDVTISKVQAKEAAEFEKTAVYSARYGPFPSLARARSEAVSLVNGDLGELKGMRHISRHGKVKTWKPGEA